MMFTELTQNWEKFLFIIIIALEFYRPFYTAEKESAKRFSENFGHAVLANFLIIIGFFVIGYSLKYLDHSVLSKGFISSSSLALPFKILISFVILDVAIYWQHRLSHKVKFLWAFHQVHHQDTLFTTSTALRFHFGEIIMSLLYKVLIISFFGISLKIFLAFEAFLFACAAFNHSNLKLPPKIEKALDFILVTPKFHRIHHSIVKEEQHSNYSFSVPWWDMIFKSHTSKKDILKVGLSEEDLKVNQSRSFLDQLKTPFNELKVFDKKEVENS